ncbi:hypothetical protein PXK58_20020 [Phaeobacter gallaeciensis]|uniref:hypothetical protein n=1 Tax=Phaeobacter gallaeciensis TaxID=60890 RepID=UPI00237FEF39|nr:hypothetical protein [Phaeobacter gallaeciensis]MDE4276605.1 hypothetical protein [Phaeobacter gallaeciensis]MDE4301835.1 hypothetical protein [Phaeobacter gallaeciensis]MDE5187005.1 hypothetical protein [Phaeobacter gallaeciensis]
MTDTGSNIRTIKPSSMSANSSNGSSTKMSVAEFTRLHPENAAALRTIMSTFVDLGFGETASQQSKNAANKSCQLSGQTKKFCR